MEGSSRATRKKKTDSDKDDCHFEDIIPDEEELEQIFGGSDFSDMDPTYVPDEDLLTLEDLKGPVLEFIAQANAADSSESESTVSIDVDSLNKEQNDFIPLESVSVVCWILEKVLIKVAKRTRVLRRWRKANPREWSRNVAKKRRAEGLPYVTGKKLRVPKVPKTVDCSKCSFKCDSTFDEETRLKLCRHYWNLDFKNKKAFILSNITIQDTKRVLVIRKSLKKARKYSKKCFFPIDENKIQVCQKFFTRTLCISDSVINDAIVKRDELGFYSTEDSRGRHAPSNKTDALLVKCVKDHIESFPTMEPHYIRSTSKRKYLDKNLSIKKMYDLFVQQWEEKHESDEIEEEDFENDPNKKTECPISEITYRRIFSSDYNLSFFVPKKDQCKICTNYEKASPEKKQAMQDSYEEHISRKEKIFQEKQKDKDRANKEDNFISATFDLQAVLQIPSGLVGQLYYCRKICVYNLCIYEAALPNDGYCLTWSEVNGKRGSCEIGSVLYHYLTKCVPINVNEVCLYSDTCGGQNRNQFICAILLYIVQTVPHIQIIDHKFMESGHSYMEVDSMHSSIENAKKHSSVFAMPDLLTIFKNARKKQTVKNNVASGCASGQKIVKGNYKVKEFKFNEFYDLKNLASNLFVNSKKDSEGKSVKWMKIKHFRYMKEEPQKVYFKYDIDDDTFAYINMKKILKENTNRRSTRSKRVRVEESTLLKQLYERPLPITEAKKKDLLKLCTEGIIPEELHGWYRSLRSDENMVDRVPEPGVDEESEAEE